MKISSKQSKRSLLGRSVYLGLRASALLSLPLVAGAITGCLNRPVEPVEPRTTSTVVERLAQSSIERIDILLVIDNSGSMGDKQTILAKAVPDLVEGLVNPACLDENGAKVAQPALPTEDCPLGSEREVDPIFDVHIGVVSTSLGAHGVLGVCDDNGSTHKDDGGHLISRKDEAGGENVPTYQDHGFLAWDPKKQLTPPGDAELHGDGGLVDKLSTMVSGAGQNGCGYESQLESFYRFLIEPRPYERVVVEDVPSGLAKSKKTGEDKALLAERADFLRPDSLLAIVLLTDENDCSIKDEGYGWLAAAQTPMLKARHECEADPNDVCCKPCLASQGSCPDDPTCGTGYFGDNDPDDNNNLRCFDQKRRFGIDLLYPIERYVAGLTSETLTDDDGNVVPNPLYADLDPTDDLLATRSSRDVFFAGIVGVPWQDIARDPKDLKAGLKTSADLAKALPQGMTTWDVILGDPANYVPPQDPLMIESIDARTGQNPITGDVPAANGTHANPINGHERVVPDRKDLQYACIFPIDPVDCKDPANGCSECKLKADGTPVEPGNPLCDLDADGKPTIQARAKAYPGSRQLSVLKGVGDQGIVASVCPSESVDTTAVDYGYRPAIAAVVDRLKKRLGGQCLPRQLAPDDAGQVSCLIMEARHEDKTCDCSGKGRSDVAQAHSAAVSQAVSDPANPVDAPWNCFCEIDQLAGDALEACQSNPKKNVDLDGASVDGWCYIDAGTASSEVFGKYIAPICASSEMQEIRFVGEGGVRDGSVAFITCEHESE